MAVGAIQNNQNGTAMYGDGTTLPLFDGELGVSAASILIRYTYFGDANLDGVVNASDFTLIDAGSVGHLTGWLNGDFNYDGVVDGADYALMDNAFNQQGALLTNNLAPSALAARGIRSVSYDSGSAVLTGSLTEVPIGAAGNRSLIASSLATAVPEPTSAVALVGLVAGLAGRRRRR